MRSYARFAFSGFVGIAFVWGLIPFSWSRRTYPIGDPLFFSYKQWFFKHNQLLHEFSTLFILLDFQVCCFALDMEEFTCDLLVMFGFQIPCVFDRGFGTCLPF